MKCQRVKAIPVIISDISHEKKEDCSCAVCVDVMH